MKDTTKSSAHKIKLTRHSLNRFISRKKDLGHIHSINKEDKVVLVLPEQELLLNLLCVIITSLWRIRNKLPSEGKIELPSEVKYIPRHVQRAWEAIMSSGFNVIDFDNDNYTPGMAVSPIAFQHVAGIESEIIIETIKPSIYFKDILIQRADVIIAVPERM